MNQLVKSANIISLIYFLLAFIAAFYSMITQSYIALSLFLPMIALFLLTIRKLQLSKNFYALKQTIVIHRKRVWFILQFISCVIMLLFINTLCTNFSDDLACIENLCFSKALNNTWGNPWYIVRYSNNRFFTVFLYIYFYIVKLIFPFADTIFLRYSSKILSFIALQISFLFTYKNARLVFKNEYKALVIGLINLICIPFYLCVQRSYTEVLSLPFITSALFVYLKLKNNHYNSIKKVFLIGILTCINIFIFQIRIMAFIFVIALTIDAFIGLKSRKRPWKQVVLSFLLGFIIFCGGNIPLSYVVKHTLPITPQASYNSEFPYTHWIMMALKPGSTGGYNYDDVLLTTNAGNLEEKKQANIAEIKNRLNELGVSGTIYHVFFEKLKYIWGDNTLHFKAYFNTDTYVTKTNNIFKRLFGNDGDLNWISDIYLWIFHIAMIMGIIFETLVALTQPANKQNLMWARYAVLGSGLFMLFWECNSRYLLPFLPLMIILSSQGWYSFIKLITQPRYTPRRYNYISPIDRDIL